MRESSFLQTFMLSLSRRTFPAINQDETLLELEQISFIIYFMDSEQDVKEYRPELIPRRGEAIAWLGTLMVVGTWVILILIGNRVSFWLPILGVPLALVAIGISLGNWMDRRTILKVSSLGINFRNGLRWVEIGWNDIREVRVLPAQWGKKVQVFSEGSYFGFHTLGEVSAHGKSLGRTGFKEGEQILKMILDQADLKLVQQVDVGNTQEGYYYARE
jgi:hypothetical protein